MKNGHWHMIPSDHDHSTYRQQCKWYVRPGLVVRFIRRILHRVLGDKWLRWVEKHDETCALMFSSYPCVEERCIVLYLEMYHAQNKEEGEE